jgi:hypothetical protein
MTASEPLTAEWFKDVRALRQRYGQAFPAGSAIAGYPTHMTTERIVALNDVEDLLYGLATLDAARTTVDVDDVLHLLDAIAANDEANIHGWSVKLRLAIAALEKDR